MNRIYSVLIRAGVIAGFVVSAAQASAQSAPAGGGDIGAWAKPGRFFTGTKGYIGTFHLPRFKSPFQTSGGSFNNGYRFTTNAKPVVFGTGRFLGYLFRDGDLPAWLGERVRVSVGGRLWLAALRQNEVVGPQPTNTRVSVASLDGQFGTTSLFANRSPGQVNFRLDMSGYELSVRLAGERRLSRRLKFRHFLAIWGGRSQERYRVGTRLRGEIAGTPVAAAAYHLDETVRSNRIGSAIGVGLSYRVYDWLTVGAGTQAGPYWIRSSLKGADCFGNAAIIQPVGAACQSTLLPAGSFRTTVSDVRSTIGFRATMTTSVSVDLGFGTLSLSGYANYDSAVPGVSNPFVVNPAAGSDTSGPAKLKFRGGLNYGGMVMLRLPLTWLGL